MVKWQHNLLNFYHTPNFYSQDTKIAWTLTSRFSKIRDDMIFWSTKIGERRHLANSLYKNDKNVIHKFIKIYPNRVQSNDIIDHWLLYVCGCSTSELIKYVLCCHIQVDGMVNLIEIYVESKCKKTTSTARKQKHSK